MMGIAVESRFEKKWVFLEDNKVNKVHTVIYSLNHKSDMIFLEGLKLIDSHAHPDPQRGIVFQLHFFNNFIEEASLHCMLNIHFR